MSEPLQRLFFAIWPDEGLRRQLAVLLPALASQGGRPVAAENLHLTLAFPGHVSSSQRQCLEAWADRVAFAPFELHLDRLGYWPRPRVVWLGPTEWPAQLDALAVSLSGGMRECGLKPDPRPYAPHMTLLRKARALPDTPNGLPLHWQVKDFVLCESRPQPTGVVYQVLRRWSAATP